jgi:hypothetical protein
MNHARNPGALSGFDIVGGVADDQARIHRKLLAVDHRASADGDPGHLRPVARARPVSSEGKEPVEPRPMELDVGGRFEVAGDPSEQVPGLEQPGEQIVNAAQHPVPVRLGDGLIQVVKAPFQEPGELRSLGVTVQQGLERLASDVWVRQAGLGNAPMSAGIRRTRGTHRATRRHPRHLSRST